MSTRLVILGTGGNAYDVLDIVEAQNRIAPTWDILGFLDDAKRAGSDHLNFPILGALADAGEMPADCLFINAIGSDKSYRRRPAIIKATGLAVERFATLIHPLAAISSRATIGRGVYVGAGVSVAGNVTVAEQVSISAGVIIGHDSVVEAYSMLAPRVVLSGFTSIGRACYIGAGAMLRQHVQVGEGALVGMGAVVLDVVDPETTVIGIPSKPLRQTHCGMRADAHRARN